MDYIDSLITRSADFARQDFNPALRMLPSSKSLIIGCVDPRVDPARIFALEQGEVGILRNVGGRVTPAMIETLALLNDVARGAGGRMGPEAHVILLHHTDCGIDHCRHLAPDLLARHMGVAPEALDEQAIADPHASVARDVATLMAHPDVVGERSVSGLVYDVATGSVEVIVPPTRVSIITPSPHA